MPSRKKKSKKSMVPVKVVRRIHQDALFIQLWKLTYFGGKPPLKKHMNLCPMFWRTVILGPLAVTAYFVYYSWALGIVLLSLIGHFSLSGQKQNCRRSEDSAPFWLKWAAACCFLVLAYGDELVPSVWSWAHFFWHWTIFWLFEKRILFWVVASLVGVTLLGGSFFGLVKLFDWVRDSISLLSLKAKRWLGIVLISVFVSVLGSGFIVFVWPVVLSLLASLMDLIVEYYFITLPVSLYFAGKSIVPRINSEMGEAVQRKISVVCGRLGVVFKPTVNWLNYHLASYQNWLEERRRVELEERGRWRAEKEAKKALKGEGSLKVLGSFLYGLYKQHCPIWEIVR